MKIVIFLLGIFLAVNADAATYWVNTAASGQHCVNSGTDPGSGSSSQTISQGVGCLSGGDTLKVNNGTYVEQISSIPSGSSVAPTTLQSVNALGAIIKPNTSGAVIGISARAYIKIDSFTLDGASQPNAGGDDGISISDFAGTHTDHVTITNNEVKNFNGDCMQLGSAGGETTNLYLANNTIHDCALGDSSGQVHGIYFKTIGAVVEKNVMYNVANGYGFHFYDGFGGGAMDSNIVRGNKLYGGIGTTNTSAAILVGGSNMTVYNNVIYDNARGIAATQGGSAITIYSNTLFANAVGVLNDSVSSLTLENNILFNNTSTIDMSGGGTQDYNYCNTGCTGPHTIISSSDPFVSSGTANFNLATSSAPIDAGLTLGAPYNVDYAGTLRPQGKAYDMGAFEYIFGPSGAPTGMVAFNGGTGVAIGSCGSSASIVGNDSTGTVTIGGGTVTSCSVNFSGTYGAAPNCIVSLGATGATFGVTSTTSGFTVATSADVHGGSLSYMCVQKGKQ